MSRVYFDTLLFIYWLEDKEPYSSLIEQILHRMQKREDTLCTSVFTIGELLVAPKKRGDVRMEDTIKSFFRSSAVEILPFTQSTTERFALIRGTRKVSSADAIHLATASEAATDLFLTNDLEIRKMTVPGIKFIDGPGTTVLGSGDR